jgi:hypothetical protein
LFRVEANDPTTDSIPLTIEICIQGEGTLVESRIRSGDMSVAKTTAQEILQAEDYPLNYTIK